MNARFSALHGASGVRNLDLYGRAPSIVGGAAEQTKQDMPVTGTPSHTSGAMLSPSTRLKMKVAVSA